MSDKFLNTTMHSVAWINKRHLDDELELKPPFQRNPVWSDAQKSYLIDTILKGFPIPELYIQEYTDASGNDVYVVVDGQQRLRSCVEFIGGDFELCGKDIDQALVELKFEDLNDDQKKTIFNYNFVVRKLPQMDDEDIRAIFKRINKNVAALTQQELRHSTYSGPFIQTMEALSNDDRWTMFSIFSANDIRRMSDVEFVSELAVGVLHGFQNKKSSLDKWYAAYETEFEQESSLRSKFARALGEIAAILPNLAATRWRKKSDFYSLFLLFASRAQDLPLSSDQREQVRAKLIEFGQSVDAFIDNPEMDPPPPENVRAYTLAVERAASDLANRRARDTQLRNVLGW
jgi:hypothetical protein